MNIRQIDQHCRDNNLRIITTQAYFIGGWVVLHTGFRREK